MSQEDYLQPLTHCTLCEHRFGVNRLEGQTGVCRTTMPVVASATLDPAPPESYTIFKVFNETKRRRVLSEIPYVKAMTGR